MRAARRLAQGRAKPIDWLVADLYGVDANEDASRINDDANNSEDEREELRRQVRRHTCTCCTVQACVCAHTHLHMLMQQAVSDTCALCLCVCVCVCCLQMQIEGEQYTEAIRRGGGRSYAERQREMEQQRAGTSVYYGQGTGGGFGRPRGLAAEPYQVKPVPQPCCALGSNATGLSALTVQLQQRCVILASMTVLCNTGIATAAAGDGGPAARGSAGAA